MAYSIDEGVVCMFALEYWGRSPFLLLEKTSCISLDGPIVSLLKFVVQVSLWLPFGCLLEFFASTCILNWDRIHWILGLVSGISAIWFSWNSLERLVSCEKALGLVLPRKLQLLIQFAKISASIFWSSPSLMFSTLKGLRMLSLWLSQRVYIVMLSTVPLAEFSLNNMI